ncbi:uncharacterized protein [Typha angustifolia]|uniref:uncharacterized protein isoform X1 n=1 Tax=Typha angustifolia TaxID=59011 RepID=UPI003C2B8295
MFKVKKTSYGASNEQAEHRFVKGSEIFVGGLPRTVTESMIRELFSPCGEIIEVRMMKDQSGNSKGFCFVRFMTKEAALQAQKEKNRVMLQGKNIGVALSSDQDSLFFGNLRKEWCSEEFDKLVRQAFQDVLSVELAMPSSSENSSAGRKQLNRGFAFVRFSSHADAARAYRIGSKSDFLLGGLHPSIDWAEEPEIDPEEMAKIKTAFVGNLPTSSDEEYLKKLFEPLGKVERVALSRKGHFPVGFVHFAKRSDLDNAIKEMDGKTIQGPHRGPSFKIQVSVARPAEKDRKRVRDEAKSEPGNKSKDPPDYSYESHVHNSLDRQTKAPRLANMVPASADPYETAVLSLPSAVKERLLQVLRLGIATRYDVDIHCITSLKELPESAAIAVLDQFILSGRYKLDKGAYFSSLVAKHHMDKFAFGGNPSLLPRSNYIAKDSALLNLGAPHHGQGIDHTSARYSSYSSSPGVHPYTYSLRDDPLLSQSSGTKLGETTSSYGKLHPSFMDYKIGNRSDSQFTSSAERPAERPRIKLDLFAERPAERPQIKFDPFSERPAERPRIKFDPFTGQPYRFDPFTGEPL